MLKSAEIIQYKFFIFQVYWFYHFVLFKYGVYTDNYVVKFFKPFKSNLLIDT